MEEAQVAHFLIEKGYHLTALELFCESYERNGTAIEELAEFFEDSANFLMFEDMRSVSEISASVNEQTTVSNDAMRIKDDRIAVLEHDIKVLRDSLDEAEAQLQKRQTSIELKPPPTNFSGPAADDEDIVINILISKYMQSRGLKLSTIAFNNETSNSKQSDRVKLPDDVDLIHLLRAFKFVQHSPQLTDEVDKLRVEKAQQRDIINKLTAEQEVLKKQLEDFQSKLNEKSEEIKQEAVVATPTIVQSTEPPSTALLNYLYSQIPQIIAALPEKSRGLILGVIEAVIHYHPDRTKRFECIQLLFTLFDNPDSDQRAMIVKSVLDSQPDPEIIESELLPVISQYLASSKTGVLCLVSHFVSALAPLSPESLRHTFLLSIIKQLSEHSLPAVRAASASDGAVLVRSLGEGAEDKVDDLLALSKLYAFDADSMVQSAGLDDYTPALLGFLQRLGRVGESYCEFWFGLLFSFGLTGSSSLAALRFKLCEQSLSAALPFLVPARPTPAQTLVREKEDAVRSDAVVAVRRSEFDWIAGSLVAKLPRMSPLLFVPIGVRREADRLVAAVCARLGQQFASEIVLPTFSRAVEENEGEAKLQHVTMLVSAVVPYCGEEEFFAQSRNFLTYATNELRGFKSRDIQEYIAPAFASMTARDPAMRPLVFRLVDELSRASRAAIRTAALAVLVEVLPALEQAEIASGALPIVARLASDPDETLLLEVVNCVGAIARFSTVFDVLRTVKELFEAWLHGAVPIRLQALRVFAVIVGDVEMQFRDSFLLPKLLECAADTRAWAEAGARDQAMMLILHIVHSLEDVPDEVIASTIGPLLEEFAQCDLTASDPKLEELRQRYAPILQQDKSFGSFLSNKFN